MVENELNKENKSKHELQQLLYDTKSIIDNISKHENDSNLVNTLKNNFVTIEATLSNSTKHKKRINKISLRTSNDLLPNDIANIGQTRIEKINTIKSQFYNDNEIKSSKPWKPNDQHCIKRYFQLNCDKNINKEINEIKPLSPSLNYINKIEKEINEIHNKIKHKHKEIEEIEIVGIDIPLNQYYLKDADYNNAKENLKNKINLKLTKKDINKIFKNKKMNINEFNKRLNKLNKIELNNVELKFLDEELKKINDDINNDKMFDNEILTKFLTKFSAKPQTEHITHGHLKHLDSTLTLHHPFHVKLRTGTNTPNYTPPNELIKHESKQYTRSDMNSMNYSNKYNKYINFTDFINGKSNRFYIDPNDVINNNCKKKQYNYNNNESMSPNANELYINMFKGWRKKHPQYENWWIKQFHLKKKEKQTKSNIKRKQMVQGKHSTDSSVQLKSFPYNYKFRYKFGKSMAKKVTIDQMLKNHDISIAPIDRAEMPSAGMYKRCRAKCIRTQMWSPSRSQSFICRK